MNGRLSGIVEGKKSPAIVVVGDIILDRYVRGKIERISPESPAQVLDVTEEEEMLGGAANVAANVVAMGGKATLVGVVGDDDAAKTIRHLLKKQKINAEGLVSDRERPTTRKTRLMALNQQMLRVDRERRHAIKGQVAKKLVEKVEKLVAKADGVIISDYGKGALPGSVIKKIIGAANKRKIKVIVDPKGTAYKKYAGVSLITPNKKEAAKATDITIKTESDFAKAAKILFRETKADNILITRGGEGMSLFYKNGKSLLLPAEALEVFDVSGAGDTVTAAVAVFHFGGASLEDSARIANVAASIEVTHVGAKAVDKDEILASLKPANHTADKILTKKEAAQLAASLRAEGKTVVFTNGCFDILHAGHITYLEKARALGDELIIGLNTDSSVKKLGKGDGRPVTGEKERAKVLAALSCVSAVTLFGEETPLKLIEAVKPDILVKGGDYLPQNVVGAGVVEKRGGKVMIMPLVKGRSTTAIIGRIKKSQKKKEGKTL